MLGSSSHEYEHEVEDPTQPLVLTPHMIIYNHHHHHHHQMCQLLLSCAGLISRSDFSSAHRLLSFLSTNSSPYGDATERLVHQFTKSLSLRLNNNLHSPTTATDTADHSLLHSSYLSLNQITPFIRFTHLTANQAILESIGSQPSIHILDFDIMHGVQWPPLMQAIADKYPTPSLRITATGPDLHTLLKTGDRLTKFAHSLGLKFQFHPLLIREADDPTPIISSSVLLIPNEALAVNCVLYLHRVHRDQLRHLLQRIKSMNPRVVTVAEREASHNHPLFLGRFAEAVDHYAVLFHSLEATVPPNSGERMAVEQVWFGREIRDVVAAEGEGRRERHERFRWWDGLLKGCGYRNVALSPFALSQAKLLLRLHYPSEGYSLHIFSNSFFLGWKNHHLFSVSSWH